MLSGSDYSPATPLATPLVGTVVVCTERTSKEPHKQVSVGMVMKSESLCGVMVCTLARNVRNVDSVPALGAIFPIFITPMTQDSCDQAPACKAMLCIVVEPTLCMYGKATACMFVNIHRLTIPRG